MHWFQAIFLLVSLSSPSAQYSEGRIVSEHLRLRIPAERDWLGRETIGDLERCWRYIHGVTGEKLPRRIAVEVVWDRLESSANVSEGSISIGMGHPAARSQPKAYLLHSAAREMARLALAELSGGAALREDIRSLTEGMVEIIAREYLGLGKSLASAWVLAHFLDATKPLSLASQSSSAASSGGRPDLCAAAPGITFLLSCRELHGRERVFKLFDALKKGKLEEALTSTFRTPAKVLEEAWLKKLRSYRAVDDIIVTSADDSPVLRETTFVPPSGRRGSNLEMRLLIQDKTNDLSPGSVFVVDEGSNQVIQGRGSAQKDGEFTVFQIAIDEKRQPGRYGFTAFAVDDAGNIRHWEGAYTIVD
jgi:hypothetical protein